MSYSTHAATTNASKHRQAKYMKLHDGMVHLFRPGGLREALTIKLAGFWLILVGVSIHSQCKLWKPTSSNHQLTRNTLSARNTEKLRASFRHMLLGTNEDANHELALDQWFFFNCRLCKIALPVGFPTRGFFPQQRLPFWISFLPVPEWWRCNAGNPQSHPLCPHDPTHPIQRTLFTTDPVMPLFSGAIQDPQSDLGKH